MASILASLLVFVVVVEVLKRQPGPPGGGGEFELLRVVFYAIAIAMVFVTSLVHAIMVKRINTDDIRGVAARLTTVSVVMSGLAETPLILGFVLFLGWGYYTDFYILGFVSLYLMLRHFPWYGQWEKIARNRLGAGWPAGPVGG